MHGIFDSDAIAGTLVRSLAEKKGINPDSIGTVGGKAYQEHQYDLLAKTLREHIDIEAVYRILREGVE